jgi:transposase-like protein
MKGVPNKRKLNQEQVEQIAELRERGWSYARIAMKFGVSDGAIHYQCLRMGAVSPRSRGKNAAAHLQPAIVAKDGRTQRRFTPQEDEQLQQLSIEGKKISEIVAITGRAPTSVRMRLMTLALHEEMV